MFVWQYEPPVLLLIGLSMCIIVKLGYDMDAECLAQIY